MSLEDEASSGRPLDATDEEKCKKVRDLVYSDRRIQVEEIAQALGISHGSVSIILHDRLGMRKLTVKGVIMLDFLPKRNTITGVYYANLLDQLRTAIFEKR